MKILSCGAGMQSTALALMSCENKHAQIRRNNVPYPLVPVYDAIIFCDLGLEPDWVLKQVDFIWCACRKAGIPFYIIQSNLYEDYMQKFGRNNVSSIPFWSVDENGKKAKMRRHCTMDYKTNLIEKFLRHELLGYRKYQRLKPEDVLAHEMHIGFSYEERRRISDTVYSKLFIKKYPLVEMKWERKDSYRYILETWGLDTKASACCFCPFHRNYFFQYIKRHAPEDYQKTVAFDRMIGERQKDTAIRSKIYISRSRKRIEDLLPEECNDAQTFPYRGRQIWNGF